MIRIFYFMIKRKTLRTFLVKIVFIFSFLCMIGSGYSLYSNFNKGTSLGVTDHQKSEMLSTIESEISTLENEKPFQKTSTNSPELPNGKDLTKKTDADISNSKQQEPKEDTPSEPDNAHPINDTKPDENQSEIQTTLSISDVSYQLTLPQGSSVYNLLQKAKNTYSISFAVKDFGSMGFFIEELNGIKNNAQNGTYWIFYINGSYSNVGISKYILQSNDVITWKYENSDNSAQYILSSQPELISISLRIEGPRGNIVHQTISLSNNCRVKDSSGTIHEFINFKAICALQFSKEHKLISNFQVTDFGFGFSLDRINDIAAPPDWSKLWIIRTNYQLSDAGIDTLDLKENDLLLISFGSWPSPPLQLVSKKTTFNQGESTLFSLQHWDDNHSQFVAFQGTASFIINKKLVLSSDGTLTWNFADAGQHQICAEAELYTRAPCLFATVKESPKETPSTPDNPNKTPNEPTPPQPIEPAPTPITILPNPLKKVSINSAAQFLVQHQNKDGSIGSDALYTDWAAIGLGSVRGYQVEKDLLRNYFHDHPLVGNRTTDYERRSMALLSLGMNPYTSTSTNYIAFIVDQFDGSQIGDPEEINDDIFAIILLRNAGFHEGHPLIQSITTTLLSYEHGDGSFGNVDITSAAIQAFALLPHTKGVPEVLTRSRNYIRRNQLQNGGFGNIYSTSWSIMAIHALNEDPDLWNKEISFPESYLAFDQQQDGGFGTNASPDNRIWSTSYALAAISGKTWDAILVNVPIFTPQDKPRSQKNKDASVDNIPPISQSSETLEKASFPAEIQIQKPLVSSHSSLFITQSVVGSLINPRKSTYILGLVFLISIFCMLISGYLLVLKKKN